MARNTEDAQITSKEARSRLPERHEPYWRGIEGGVALGYRKGKLAGMWLVRLRDGTQYRKSSLGRADDAIAATAGVGEQVGEQERAEVLSFRQAQAKALAWAQQTQRVAAGLEAVPAPKPAKPHSVADAIGNYMADYAARGGKGVVQTQRAVNAHILPSLGDEAIIRLTREKIKKWHRGLATSPAHLRSAKDKPPKIRHVDNDDEDAPRRRRATANRILTVLKAALNHARHEGAVRCSDDAWATVAPFKGADAPKIRYLTDEETTRLLNACAGDFRDLVTAALLTGCRYGEVTRLKVGDFDKVSGTLYVGIPKEGKPRHVVLTAEGTKFFERMTTGRSKNELIMMRDHTAKQATLKEPAVMERAAWGGSHQHMSCPWFHGHLVKVF